MSDRGRVVLASIVLAVCTGAAYCNSLSAAFVFDDRPHIFGNDRITTVFPLAKTLSGRRPVVDLTLAMNHAVGGFDPAGYHLFNLAVHILAGLTLFALLRRLCASASPRQGNPSRAPIAFPFAVSLLWMLHPLQTQSVTYVIQRGESMMGLFYLFTLYAATRGIGSGDKPRMRFGWLAASVVSCALGMATKAVMVTAPLMVLLYDWIIVTRSLRRSLRARWGFYAALSGTLSVLALCGVASGVLSTTGHPNANVGFAVSGITPADYLLTQPGVLLHYLRLTLWPSPLCIDYAWPIVTSLSGAAFPAAPLVLLLTLSLWACRRYPLAGFAGLSFFVILAPTSSIVPIRDPLFEHRMYLPLAAILGLLVYGGAWLLRRVCRYTDERSAAYRVTGAVILGVVATALGAVTFHRNADYQSEIKIWTQATTVRPHNARAHYSLGVALGRAKQFDASQQSFRRAIEESTDLTRHDVLAEAYYHVGWSLIRREHASEAIAEFRAAVALNPDHVEATFELGWGLAMLGRYREAAEAFRRTLELAPDHPQAKKALADAQEAASR